MPLALVVDDSKAIRLIMARTLSELGWEVRSAANGMEALEELKKISGQVRLAMLDWNMPEMSGFELLVRIRADAAHRAMRVMMVTTETEVEQMTRALEAGADEYLMKPFTRAALEDKLRLLGVLGGAEVRPW